MTAGRGDRAAPPAADGHWEVRFADAASAKGWESLAQQARENTYRAWFTMRTTPGPATETPRHHRLKGGLAHGTHRGQTCRAMADRGDRRRPDLVPPGHCPRDLLDHLRGHWTPASHRPTLSQRSLVGGGTGQRESTAGNDEDPARSSDRTGSSQLPDTRRVVAVDLRGFEPLAPSMRTRCATGLRHRPLQRVKL